MDFSIIIPHYNIPCELKRLLDSIPKKDNLEIIVVDDKSNERLEEYEKIKSEYASDRCCFFENNTKDKGAGVCRNIGIKNSKGKWLFFADADDYFAEGFFDTVSDYIDRDEDVIFFFPDSICLDSGKRSDRHVAFCDILGAYIENPNKKNELRLRYEVVSPWSKMIRRSMVIENNIEFENTRVANDVMFCRKIGHHADKISVEKKTIYIVTQREGSLTTLKDKDAYFTRLDVFIRSCNYVRDVVNPEDWKLLKVDGGYFLHICKDRKMDISVWLRTIKKLLENKIIPIRL